MLRIFFSTALGISLNQMEVQDNAAALHALTDVRDKLLAGIRRYTVRDFSNKHVKRLHEASLEATPCHVPPAPALLPRAASSCDLASARQLQAHPASKITSTLSGSTGPCLVLFCWTRHIESAWLECFSWLEVRSLQRLFGFWRF